MTTVSASTPDHGLSRGRVRLALLALALGGFAIGCTEFVAMGLLPNIARELIPTVYAVSPTQANGQAGLLVSAYAAGVVVGAPTIAALSARFPRRTLLLWLLVAFTVMTVASAVLPTFGLVLAARFLAGLPHGAYFGVAALVAASLMGPGTRGRGIAFILGGLTIANVVGVPAITFLGQTAGWRIAYLAVAAIFAITFIAVFIVVPRQPGDPQATVRRELTIFARPQVWFALAIGAIGFGGFFAVFTYVAPIVTNVTGLPESFVPIALVVGGVGMTVGNFVGGHMADKSLMRGLFAFFGALIVGLVGLALTAQTVVGVLVFIFVIGAASAAVSPAIQTRLMNVAGESQTLAAAINHASLNIGNSFGAALGGAAIGAGLGYLSVTWVGVALCALGVIIAVISFGAERRSLHRAGSLGLQKDAVLDGTLP
ncbi:MAG: transporter, family, inner rane transport protein [Actinomycetota bacterium]|jgi:DHA1 family inner membrane transport protein|nr:transporter, family, inner rane transport protein [Actinomycetota bacterium]